MDDRDDASETPPPPGDYADFEAVADAEWARLVAGLEAGTEPVPPDPEDGGQGISLSLGEACDLDPALLAAMAGPGGLGGQALGPAFGQGGPADALRPGPVLAALTAQAVAGIAARRDGGPAGGALTDDERAGVVQAAQRLENWSAYLRTVAVGDFARDRAAQYEAARARKVPAGRRPGEFPAEELSAELLVGPRQAEMRIEHDRALTGRLPATLAGMAAGLVSLHRADVIAAHTLALSDADAAHADQVLAAIAPGLRADQLARKAAALEMKLDPDAVRARKEHAKRLRRRVEVRREDSGNASIAGRELDTADALACKAYVDAAAVRLRNSGLVEGTLDFIRARAMTELLQGRDPLDLIRPRPRLRLRPRGAGPAGPARGETPPAAPAPDSAPPAGPPAGRHRRDADPRASDRANGGDGDNRGASDACGAGTRADGPGTYGRAAPDPDDPGPDYPGDPGDPDRCDDSDDLGDFCDPDAFDDPGAPIPEYHGPGGAPPWTPGEAELARQDDTDDRPDIDDLLPRRGPLRPGESAPPPANINLIIPIGTLLGFSAAPAHAGAIGLLDPQETQALVAAASRHPRTRWSATIVDPSGRAIAHGRARGQHPWNPPPPEDPSQPPPRQDPPSQPPPGTPPATAGQLAKLQDLLRDLNITTDPIAQRDCDHQHAENRYTPSRKLRDLLRARSQTCDAPGCSAQAAHCDQDHTTPYPQGPTCECNLGPKCRRHHRAKQAPDWRIERPQPGTTRWTLPNGRTHTTHPTTYDT